MTNLAAFVIHVIGHIYRCKRFLYAIDSRRKLGAGRNAGAHLIQRAGANCLRNLLKRIQPSLLRIPARRIRLLDAVTRPFEVGN